MSLINDAIEVMDMSSIPDALSSFIVYPYRKPSQDAPSMEAAVAIAGTDGHAEMRVTYDDAVKLVESVKTRQVKLYLMVSQSSPDAKTPDTFTRYVSGYVSVTRGALLRFLDDVYGKRRSMVIISWYPNSLFVGRSV